MKPKIVREPGKTHVMIVAHPDALDRITDRVLSYHPKGKKKKSAKRKKVKRA